MGLFWGFFSALDHTELNRYQKGTKYGLKVLKYEFQMAQ